jgi:hypothetical protein
MLALKVALEQEMERDETRHPRNSKSVLAEIQYSYPQGFRKL